MQITKLVMQNFMSHGDTELDLSGVTTCSIVGNNGVGKSSVFEAIIWALFGHARVPNKELIRSGQTKMSVTVAFTLFEQQYTVHRSCKSGVVSAQGYVNGESLATNVEGLNKKMEKVFGISRELLIESIVINQGKLSSFLTSYPSERRDLIIEALGLNRFSIAGDKAKALFKSAESDFFGHQNSYATLRTDLAEMPANPAMDVKITEASKQLDEARAKAKELTSRRDAIITQDKEARGVLQKLGEEATSIKAKMINAATDFDEKIGIGRNNVEQTNKQIAQLEGLRQSLKELEESFLRVSQLDARLKELRPEMARFKLDIDTHKVRMTIASKATDTCPVCSSQISLEQWQKIMSDMSGTLQGLMYMHDQADREVKEIGSPAMPQTVSNQIDTAKSSIAKIEGLQNSKPVLETSINSLIEQKDVRLNELGEQLKQLDSDIDVAKAKLNVELDNVERDLGIWEMAETKYLSDLTNWSSRKEGRATLENSMQRIQNQLEYYKANLPEIEFVALALSPNGIPLMIIDDYLPAIESKSQDILNSISDGKLNLKLEVLEGGKKGIDVIAGTNELRPVKSLSGGEQTRVGLSLRVALSQILFEMASCHFDILFIDEPEYLDQEGISQFVSLVNALRNYYKQIFVISHLEEMKSAFPGIINVMKQDDVSSATIDIR